LENVEQRPAASDVALVKTSSGRRNLLLRVDTTRLTAGLFGFGIFSIALSLSNEFSFAAGRLKEFNFLLRDYLVEFGVCLTLGLACWIAYFSIVRRLQTS
jgi:hypothetical protein